MNALLNSFKDFLSTLFGCTSHNQEYTTNSSGIDTFWTIFAGVVVFVICEWVKEVWLSPLQEYKKLKSKVSKTLILYACYYSNPIPLGDSMREVYSKASDEIRELASEVSAFAEVIPFIHWGIPKAKNIIEAGKCLIGISNRFFYNSDAGFDRHLDENDKARKEIKKLLKLK